MHAMLKRIGTASLAIIFALAMMLPLIAVPQALAEDEPITPVPIAEATPSDPASPADQSDVSDPADDCSLTLVYTSNPTGDEEPGTIFDDDGRVILGTRTLTGFHEGQTVSAWDYVVRIPGHIFFDAWPATITISKDPAQNVFTFIYLKLHDYEYTVNYYLMTGADLTADNWTDALAPEDVSFYKMGSEVFSNQQYDTLVKGDAYEYQLDDVYVIDTYPAEIRIGTDADKNVINVLYTPSSQHLPDDMVVPDDTVTPPNTTLPDDTIIDDDTTATLPDDFTPSDKVEITDEMLENPLPQQEAEQIRDAYLTGRQVGFDLAQTGDDAPIALGILVLVAAVAFAGVIYGIYRYRHPSSY